MNWSGNILVFALRVYQRVVSPALAGLFGPTGRCRFEPSCSQYAVTAIQLHGAARGSALAVQRICRCHPWGGSGWDPVPASKFKVQSLKFKVGETAKELKVQSAFVPQAGLGRDQSLKFKVAAAESKSMRPYRRSLRAVPRIFHGS